MNILKNSIVKNVCMAIAPILVILVCLGGWAITHKLYTDHNTQCTIVRSNYTPDIETPVVRYTGIRKSSIKIEPNEYLEFVMAEDNLKLKFVGNLNYAILCPTNLKQQNLAPTEVEAGKIF